MASIHIISPNNNALVCDETVDVLGRACEVNYVFINGIIAVLNGDIFTAQIPLHFGPNTIEVVFRDLKGKWQTNTLNIKRA